MKNRVLRGFHVFIFVVTVSITVCGTAAPLTFTGITDRKRVTNDIVVSAVPSVAVTGISFYVDGIFVNNATRSPYYLKGDSGGTGIPYDACALPEGIHAITAVATATDGSTFEASITFRTDGFSKYLSPYKLHPTASTKTVDQIFNDTITPGLPLHPSNVDMRKKIISMYRDFGIDLSLPKGEHQSYTPETWTSNTRKPLSGTYDAFYSADACYYHPISSDAPKVALPKKYVHAVNIKLEDESDDNFKGFMISDGSDPIRKIHVLTSGKIFTLHIGNTVADDIPRGGGVGDRNMSFLDISAIPAVVINTYGTRMNPNGFDVDCKYCAGPSPVGTLGDTGFGSNAAKIPNMAVIIRDGEATHPHEPICHAVGGPVGEKMKAMVYPALAMDRGIADVNYGILPYGGLIQLDPAVDLDAYRIDNKPLTLPARRILEAVQTYGYYIIDGKDDDYSDPRINLAFWTMANTKEYAPYKRSGFRSPGASVADEIRDVLENSQLYIVVPQVRTIN